MEWLLILIWTNPAMTTAPITFLTEEACNKVGKEYTNQYKGAARASYLCIPMLKAGQGTYK